MPFLGNYYQNNHVSQRDVCVDELSLVSGLQSLENLCRIPNILHPTAQMLAYQVTLGFGQYVYKGKSVVDEVLSDILGAF